MKMTYDDFEPGKYYKEMSGRYCLVSTYGQTTPIRKHLHWFPDNHGGMIGKDYEYNCWQGECDRDGNLLAPTEDMQ